MKETILVVEDDQNIRELIKFNLEGSGYRVLEAEDGRVGLDKLNDEVDLVILDIMMPNVDGLTFCRIIRSDEKYKNVPIIMLTAKGEELDRVLGLEMGADDYITKPFSPRELIARIKAILRRVNDMDKKEETTKKEIIKAGDIEINTGSYEVKRDGNLLELTPKEFELLRFLLANEGKVLTRDLLLEKVWGYEYSGDTRTVDVHIRRLRTKIGEGRIATVRGVGYKFVKLE